MPLLSPLLSLSGVSRDFDVSRPWLDRVLAYGMRLVSSSLLQVGPELEEAARSTGATNWPPAPSM